MLGNIAQQSMWLLVRSLISGIATAILMVGCIAGTKEAPSTPALLFSTSLSEVSPSSREKVIVFFHGVFGDPSTTWTNRSGVSWPDLLQRDWAFEQFDVLRTSYDSPLLARTSGIEEVATRILRQLEDRGVFRHYKEIYFITHSMGGLVAKRILVDLHRPRQEEKLRRVKAVLYISTPAQGANLAELGSWLSINPQLRDMRPADLNSFLQSLENQWQNLMRDRGSQVFPLSFCAYETKPTYGNVVVSRVYAATICDQNPFPVDEDHGGIVKPATMDADIYAWARARIQEAGSEEISQGNLRQNAYLRPFVLEDSFSTTIPFTDDEGDAPIPPFHPLQFDSDVRDPSFVVATKFSALAKLVSDKPQTVDDIYTFLCELLQYYFVEYVEVSQRELYGFRWTAGKGQKSTVTPAVVPPDSSLYPTESIAETLSRNRFGKNQLAQWKSKQLKVPEGTQLSFINLPERAFQLFNPTTYKLSFSVKRGLLLDNYGFIQSGFDVSSEAASRTRSFQLIVTWRFELYRTKDTDSLQQEQYTKWAQSLFQRLRKGIEN